MLLQSVSDVQLPGSGPSAGILTVGAGAADGDSASVDKTEANDEGIPGTTVLGGQGAGLWPSTKGPHLHCTPLMRCVSSCVSGGCL